MTTGAGLDATRAGWVAVVLEDARFSAAFAISTLDELASHVDGLAALAIDIPIGFPSGDRGVRQADVAARRLLGRRGSTVFPAPPPEVAAAPDYETANARSRERHGRGISRQAWAIAPKMLEATAFARTAPTPVREAHPEVSFSVLAGRLLEHSKATWAGFHERRSLLHSAGIVIPDELPEIGQAKPDDVLDAAAVAWTAHRVATGVASCHPDPPEHDEDGRPVAIWS